MLSLSEWERNNFSAASYIPPLTVIFPSREIYFSPALMSSLHLTPSALPSTLDQWYELCHPEDHEKISLIERTLSSQENYLTLTRRLYCGDGVYRPFRLDAQIIRDKKFHPIRLIGTETSSLQAWLDNSEEGSKIECIDSFGRKKILEAIIIHGVKTLRDISELDDIRQENFILRREIQRRIFCAGASQILQDLTENDIHLRDALDETLRLSLNVLAGNTSLKALHRSLSEECMTIGICGLSGSGKTLLMNALLGEKLIPEHSRVPVMCREGENRSAKIYYQDGRTETLSTKLITASSLSEIISKSGVSRLTLTIPGALIPEGICFVDTPGYDALGGTNKNILKNLLPELDAVLYVTPVRSNLKTSDYDYLKEITALTDRIIIILSQTDLETDDTEAGHIVMTREEKTARNIERLDNDMQKFSGHKHVIIPVSAGSALENFYSRKSSGWSSSNIEAITSSLTSIEASPLTRALIFRAERTLKILDSALANKTLTGSSRWRLQDYAGSLRKAFAKYSEVEVFPKHMAMISGLKQSQGEGKNLLSSLITSLREHDFRGRFFSLKAFNHERNAILLGADKAQSLKLYSLLAHNIRSSELPDGGVSSDEWLISGNYVPFECISLPVISPGENVLIAPNDDSLSKIGWSAHQKLFKKFTPVVCVDLARIDSGLNDLSHAPYLMGLALCEWVLAFVNGGLLRDRQTELLSAIPANVKDFAEAGGLKIPELFICENYRIF